MYRYICVRVLTVIISKTYSTSRGERIERTGCTRLLRVLLFSAVSRNGRISISLQNIQKITIFAWRSTATQHIPAIIDGTHSNNGARTPSAAKHDIYTKTSGGKNTPKTKILEKPTPPYGAIENPPEKIIKEPTRNRRAPHYRNLEIYRTGDDEFPEFPAPATW